MLIQRILISPRPGVLRLDIRMEERAMAERKGFDWSDKEVAMLKTLFCDGINVNVIAAKLKRTPGGVLERLKRMEFLVAAGYVPTSHPFRYYGLTPAAKVILQSAKNDFGASQWGLTRTSDDAKIEEKELDMLEVNLENKTFINGVDASKLSNDDLLKMARRLYVEGRDLQEMKQNKLVAARLEIVEKSLSNLLGYMDKRAEDKNV